jgi:hypothetical protein
VPTKPVNFYWSWFKFFLKLSACFGLYKFYKIKTNKTSTGRVNWKFSNDDRFEGHWVEETCEAEGTYTYAAGDVYKGKMKEWK